MHKRPFKLPKVMVPPVTDKDYRNLFLYWITERHNIYVLREQGAEFPWTNDKILTEYKFTNPYRENDRVTKELRIRQKEDYGRKLTKSEQLWLIILFRMFNLPETFDALHEYVISRPWNAKKAAALLKKRSAEKQQVFTGAYIITNNGSTRPKIDLVCEALAWANKNISDLLVTIIRENSIERAVETLSQIPMVGNFVAYEIVCDLYESCSWFNPRDRYLWANPGPGAKRGLNRLFSPSHSAQDNTRKNARVKFQLHAEMYELLKMLSQYVVLQEMPNVDARVVEHSLCEFDKYCRVMFNEGRPRSKFTPPALRKEK